ncbi:hypothetical protein MMC13_000654 [Lambiella insularis]|nr:hypothetical protein [Lambiella insularis]
MARQYASMESLPAVVDSHSDSPYRPSLRKRCSSYHYFAEENASKVVDLTYPDHVVFPSPPLQQDLTPLTRASKARDAFPFPAQPAHILPPTAHRRASPESPYCSARRCASHGNTYLTPPPSPDRFIPARPAADSHVASYNLGKSPEHLSSSERLLRHKSATPDPFSPRGLRQNLDNIRSFRDGTTRTSHSPGYGTTGDILGFRSGGVDLQEPRRASAGAVWNVGGLVTAGAPVIGVSNGRGGLLGSGTNAPMFNSQFFDEETADQSHERFEGRVAVALDIDQISKTLQIAPILDPRSQNLLSSSTKKRKDLSSTVWQDGKWVSDADSPVLDAPGLRDDFYCSVLAYCHTSRTLAVGLHNRVYLWSEEAGVHYPRVEENRQSTYVTSLSFSSTQGGNSVLAVGRNSGHISLWSLFDEYDRCPSQLPNAVACLLFKPVTTRRQSERLGIIVNTEELLVGDEVGLIYYYCIEWDNTSGDQRCYGAMHLMAKIDIHTQQICGLAWSPDGDYFATGGNDNVCCLFEAKEIIASPSESFGHAPLQAFMAGFVPTFVPNAPAHRTLGSMLNHGDQYQDMIPGNIIRPFRNSYLPERGGLMVNVTEGRQRHKWVHNAAVKAIAFCPWQRGLVATGGGSNDRAIHFFHAHSGACLSTITVQAQVTSLIWSTTRREIAATFGYAQPEHPYRIAVFSWPDCRQVVAIPWTGDIRALYAIPYPGGPNEATRHRSEGGRWWSRTAEEGCIVVASSDESVKFHEVWSEARKSTGGSVGLLGGSDILEGLEGIDKDGAEVIR